MRIAMVGLGRMGANMARRLMRGGHECVAYDLSAEVVQAFAGEGAIAASSYADLASKLARPRVVWLMVPAGAVDQALDGLRPHLEPGDVVIDGGNTHHVEDLRRARELAGSGIHHVDVGTSGGVWGLERGYCLMIGGEPGVVARLDPLFRALAPGRGDLPRTPGRGDRAGTAELGYLHCGPNGAGHFVKMVHNGIEYGMMAAFAEGLGVLEAANAGGEARDTDAETAPLRHPEHYRYPLDLAEITELWRRGSVVSSWLLDLTASALAKDPGLDGFSGRVSDSGEGRWTLLAGIESGVPTPALASALFARFSSRGEAAFSNKVLSAMRFEFGGHSEKPER